MGLVRSLQPWDILLMYCNNQFKKYITPLLRLASRVLSTPPHSYVYVRSFLCPFSYFNKTAIQKLLSDQAWSLVPKLNVLLWRSWIWHCSLEAITRKKAIGGRMGGVTQVREWKLPEAHPGLGATCLACRSQPGKRAVAQEAPSPSLQPLRSWESLGLQGDQTSQS